VAIVIEIADDATMNPQALVNAIGHDRKLEVKGAKQADRKEHSHTCGQFGSGMVHR
jgi:hypothetical protein